MASTNAPAAGLREELIAALVRERIAYPDDRLDEALADYAELRRLMCLIEASGSHARPVGLGAQGSPSPDPRAPPSR